MKRGFTLIELVVVIAITAVLSAVVLLAINDYINRGKDSNIYGNLVILIPAGEVWYNGNNRSYEGFCGSEVVKNAISQMPENPEGACYAPGTNPAGLCCWVNEEGSAWVAYALKFTNTLEGYCVDSRGVRKEVKKSDFESIKQDYQCS